MGPRELYLEALKCDPSYAEAYNNIGIILSRDERVRLHDGRSMGQRDL